MQKKFYLLSFAFMFLVNITAMMSQEDTQSNRVVGHWVLKNAEVREYPVNHPEKEKVYSYTPENVKNVPFQILSNIILEIKNNSQKELGEMPYIIFPEGGINEPVIKFNGNNMFTYYDVNRPEEEMLNQFAYQITPEGGLILMSPRIGYNNSQNVPVEVLITLKFSAHP